jgi:phosphopantothenoylcysteine decarboxylase/phosphopantothenate--cysteine ligase
MAMAGWTFPAPTPSDLGDHDVPAEGTHLAGRRVALLVTGGIAAMKIPFVARALRRQGASVVAFASKEALRYVTAEALEWSTVSPVVQRLTAAAEHLSDGAPFDAYLVAPATYNSINKIAAGIADGVVTSAAASALGRMERGRTAVLVAPTMHGSLHNRILVESLERLHALGVRVVPPRDAYGKHNLPDDADLVAEVCRAVSRSKLKGRRVLVTAGPMPVPIDGVRSIVPRARGEIGVAVAAELSLRGAEVTLIHGDGVSPVPSFVPRRRARTHAEDRAMVREELTRGYEAGVFSATVSGFCPAAATEAAIPSGQESLTLSLVPTANVLEEVREAHPGLYVVTFEHEDAFGHEAWMKAARARLDRFPCVVADRGEEHGEPPRAWLLTRGADAVPLDGPRRIAEAIADHLEAAIGGAST